MIVFRASSEGLAFMVKYLGVSLCERRADFEDSVYQ